MSAENKNLLKELWARFANERTAIITVVLAFLMLTLERGYFWWLHPLHQFPDQALYLEAAQWIMEGKVPYRDFFDWNPPLIMYLSMLPHMVSKLLPFHPILSLNMLIILSTLVGACVSLYIARRTLGKDEFFIFIPMCAGATFNILEQRFDMAEREQIFMIMYLPFMVLRYAVWTQPIKDRTQPDIKISRPLALITGLVGGIGLALKPQFVFAHAAFELVLFVRNGMLKTRLLRTEILAVLLVVAVYAWYLIFLLPNDAWEVLKNEVLPLFIYGYEYSSKSLMYMLHGGPYFYLPMVMFCYAMAVALFANRYSQWAAPLAAFTLTFLFNYLHGDQAWPYRMIPMVSGCYLLCGLAIGLIGKYLYYKSRAPKAVATCLLVSFMLGASIYTFQDLKSTIDYLKLSHHFHNLQDIGGYIGWTPCPPLLDLNPIFMVMTKYSNYGDKVLYMGTGINEGYPAIVQSGRRGATRYPFCPLFLIDHCILNRPEEEQARWKRLMHRQIENYKQDILRDKPALILILDYPPFVDMLKRNGFFDSCLAGYSNYTKEFNTLVYLPKWNMPKAPVKEPPTSAPTKPRSGESAPANKGLVPAIKGSVTTKGSAPTTKDSAPTTRSSDSFNESTEEEPVSWFVVPAEPASNYPDLPEVPPPANADTEPPDEIVVPAPKRWPSPGKKQKSDQQKKPTINLEDHGQK